MVWPSNHPNLNAMEPTWFLDEEADYKAQSYFKCSTMKKD